MLLSNRSKVFASAATLAAVVSLGAEDASACGGLFCNASLPVNQAAERIIFSDNGDGTVTAVIEIQYQGPSESFAWVLPVPDGELEIGVGSKLTLDRLDTQSNPTYQLNRTFGPDCDVAQGAGVGRGATNDAVAPPSSAPEESVTVVQEGTTGPYVYQVLSVSDDADDPAADLVEWLQEREYDVEDSMTELLDPYLESGLNMVAFKLDKNSDAGSVRPVMITYESEVPFIPLRPTAMAALEDMGVKVWVLGSSRAVPTTYLHLEINQALINWFAPNTNYNDVIIAAANEAGGMGFVTEQSGPAGEFVDTIYTEDEDLGGGDAWRRDQLATTDFGTGVESYQAFFTTAVAYFNGYDGFLEVMGDPEVVPLREGAGVDQFIACVECYFAEESGAGTVYPPTPFDPNSDPILDFDAFAFLDAIDAEILEPMAATRKLFEDANSVTRMYTTISPDEMLEDPAFDFNPELEDVDNQHIAEQLLECSSDEWTITLPQGMEITGTGTTWPLDLTSDMPANLRILQMSTVGGGMSVEDNAEEVAALLVNLGVGQANDELMDPPGPDPDPAGSDDDADDGSNSGPSDQQDDEIDGDDEAMADDVEDVADDAETSADDADEIDDSGEEPADDAEGAGSGEEVADGEENVDDMTSDDGGCGCRVAGAPTQASGVWAASLLALALGRRRWRKRAAS